jgi:hypothetical protein
VLKSRTVGPRVVLHLSRSSNAKLKATSPFRLRGVNLVLFFEPYVRPAVGARKPAARRLVLEADGLTASEQEAVIEIEDGSLDIIGGEIRYPDFLLSLAPPHLLRVNGGKLRLHDVRLRGPMRDPSRHFASLVQLQARKKDAPATLAAHECVLQSPRLALALHGPGCRAHLKQLVLLSGTEAVGFTGVEGGASVLLENVTVAGKKAAVSLGPVAAKTPPQEPVLVQTRDCAFLNPFGSKAGLLVYEKDALLRGALLWEGDGDLYDRGLHFGEASEGAIPEKAEKLDWRRLWGPTSVRRSLTDFPQSLHFDRDSWALERLAVVPVNFIPNLRLHGADLKRLGIVGKSR